MGATIRVTDETHEALRKLAQEMDEPMEDVLAKAVEAYRRARVLELTNQAYASLKADPQAWQELLDERAEWDVTLSDGLEDDWLDPSAALAVPAVNRIRR